MDIQELAQHSRQLNEFLAKEFVFPMNYFSTEPVLIIIFSMLFALIGSLLSVLAIMFLFSPPRKPRVFGWFFLGPSVAILLSGFMNSFLLFTSPTQNWANTANHESYLRIAEFFNETARYSVDSFETKDPSRIDIISVIRKAGHEIHRATSDEISRKLMTIDTERN